MLERGADRDGRIGEEARDAGGNKTSKRGGMERRYFRFSLRLLLLLLVLLVLLLVLLLLLLSNLKSGQTASGVVEKESVGGEWEWISPPLRIKRGPGWAGAERYLSLKVDLVHRRPFMCVMRGGVATKNETAHRKRRGRINRIDCFIW